MLWDWLTRALLAIVIVALLWAASLGLAYGTVLFLRAVAGP